MGKAKTTSLKLVDLFDHIYIYGHRRGLNGYIFFVDDFNSGREKSYA